MSNDTLSRAREFIFAHGRPIDQALFDFHFAGGTVGDVIDGLRPYQNEDGGFGHGLEPDLQTPASSVIATSMGFNILRSVGAPGGGDLVADAVKYLHAAFDTERRVWPIVPPEVEDAPHAPWWEYESSAETFGNFLVNPRVAIVGHLWHFAPLQPAEYVRELAREALTYLEAHGNDLEMYDVYCYMGVAAADGLPEELREKVEEGLLPAVRRNVQRDREKWGEHGMTPLDASPRPDAPFTAAVDGELLRRNLNWLIATQQEDGAWPLSWNWSFVDADAWVRAERAWRAYLAVENLCRLRDFGRLG